ncbi:MAG: DNA-formamidopyrimidine glycosylase [Gemmatimonadetes bacterium]|nr:DNA-formamidopyrimidine glycosylase [Gemmatimonadota bacterium]
MPELPDVEVFRDVLEEHGLERRIETVHLPSDSVLEDVSKSTLRRRLKGHRLVSTRRHGKHLFAGIDGGGWLRFHFGMTGYLASWEGDEDGPEHAKLILDFPGGRHLGYVCVRRLGVIGIVDDAEAFVEEKGLGPDARDLDLDGLRQRLEGRSGSIKGTLMNQGVVAGLGNIYVDEILYQSGVDPRARADGLPDDAARSIHRTTGRVLERAIDGGVEDFPRAWLIRRREAGADCGRCEGTIEKTEVSGRSTYFCPRHQRK